MLYYNIINVFITFTIIFLMSDTIKKKYMSYDDKENDDKENSDEENSDEENDTDEEIDVIIDTDEEIELDTDKVDTDEEIELDTVSDTDKVDTDEEIELDTVSDNDKVDTDKEIYDITDKIEDIKINYNIIKLKIFIIIILWIFLIKY